MPDENAARSIDALRSEDYVQADPFQRLRYLILRANECSRDPIDFNYIAVPRNTWEDILGIVNRG